MNTKASRRLVFLLAVVLVFSLTLGVSAKKAKKNKHLGSVNKFTGAFKTDVPIEVPKYHGLAPDVKLTYSSHGSNGWLGVGWSISAASYIQRGTENSGAPNYDSNDTFYLDGQKLIEDTSLGGTHATERQNYRRIERDSGNNKWYVWRKNGTKLTYEPINNEDGTTFRWGLKTVEDTNGNTVNYYYWGDNNQAYLDRIEYNNVKIEFHSETRSDQVNYATGVGLAKMDYRLKTIDVQVNGDRARAYDLSYKTSSTSRSVLTGVQQYGTDASIDSNGVITGGTTLPQTNLEVTMGDKSENYHNFNIGDTLKTNSEWSLDNDYLKGDVNGDGREDLIRIYDNDGTTGAVVYKSTGTSYTKSWSTTDLGNGYTKEYFAGDYNGDGKTDIIQLWDNGGRLGVIVHESNGTGFDTTWSTSDIGCGYTGQFRVGDVNGDGMTDIIQLWENGNNNLGIIVHESTGSSYDLTWNGDMGCGYVGKFRVGDVNGDKQADIFQLWETGNNKLGIIVHKSTGSGYNLDWNKEMSAAYTGQFHTGDANGDGKTDILQLWDSSGNLGVKVHGSNGTGFQTTWSSSDMGSGYTNDYRVADITGDGRSDIVQLWNNDGTLYKLSHLSTGTGYTYTGSESLFATTNYDLFFTLDMDGDGKKDFTQVHQPYTLDNPVGVSGSHNGYNMVREIQAVGENKFYIRFRDSSDGYSDKWVTYTLDQGSAVIDNSSNRYLFAGTAVTVSDSASEVNAVLGIRGNGHDLQIKIVDLAEGEEKWVTIGTLSPATFGSGPGEFGDSYAIRKVIGNGSQITFKLAQDGSIVRTESVSLSGAVASGVVDPGEAEPYITTQGGEGNSNPDDENALFINLAESGENNWDTLGFQPAGERKIRQVIGEGSQIDFVMEDRYGNNPATYPIDLSGITALKETDSNANRDSIAITGEDNGIFVKYSNWNSSQAVLLAEDNGSVIQEETTLNTAISDGGLPDLIDNITNGYGATTEVTYFRSSYWNDRQLPSEFNFATAYKLTTSDGRGNSGTSYYTYYGARYDFAEQEFRGFGYAKETLDSEDNYIQTYYKQNDASAGKIDKIYLRDNNNDYYKYMYYTYSETSSAPYESNLTQIDKYQRNLTDSPRHIKTEMTYDSYGNLTKKKEYGDVDVSGDERTTVIDHEPNTTDYIVNLPKYKEIYEGIGTDGTKMKRTQFVYDGNSSYDAEPTKGLLTRKELWDDENNKYVDHEYSYDSYGNLIKHKNPLDNVVKELTYDSTYHVYVVEESNELGHTKSKSWNYTLGKVTSITDTNGNEITKSYDVLGRKTKISYPDGGYEEYDYVDWGTPSSQHVKKTTKDSTSDNLWQKSYFDGLRRTYKLEKDGGRVKKKIYEEATELVTKESYWYDSGGSPTYIEKTYDGMGRVTKTTYPDDNYTETVYGADGVANKVAEYDELGNKKGIWKDAYGNTTKVREHNGDSSYDTLYTYDVLGRLTELEDAKGNTTTLTWDSLGRRQKLDDMDKGVITQDFNDAGQKISRIDAKGQTITYTYDAIGRLLTKEYPDGSQITYNYDETSNCTNGDGRLTSVSYPKGSLTINSYNFEGKATSKTKTVDGVSKTFDYSYDVAGRVVSITYPDGETIDYNYNEAGKIEDIPGYVDNFDYNAEGKLITAEYANGVTENFTYDGNRQWLDSAAVTNSSGTNLYEASYSRKANGLITDYNSGTHQSLSFTYDDLNRLTEVSGDQTQSFSYNKIGNITSNSQAGPYAYENSEHAHAVTLVGEKNYSYDANGNMTSAPNKTINWDYEDRVSSVDLDSGDTINFAYDENGKRILKETPTETIRYFGKALKITNGDPVKFIYAGKRLVAKKDSSGNKFWFHQDHLDSVRIITNESEEIVKNYDYRAYGKVEQSSGSLSNEFKFGGHLDDDSTGLIYMGARYYEPSLGRFISADNKVPEPGNPQSFNRYAYCNNNPVNNIDPSGEYGFSDFFASTMYFVQPMDTQINVNANTMSGSVEVHTPGQEAPLLSMDLGTIPSVSAQQIVSNPNQPIDLGLPGNPARARISLGASYYKGLGGGAKLIKIAREGKSDEYFLFLEGGAGIGGGVSASWKKNAQAITPEDLVNFNASLSGVAGPAKAGLSTNQNLTPSLIASVFGVDVSNLGQQIGVDASSTPGGSNISMPSGDFGAFGAKFEWQGKVSVGVMIPLSSSWYARHGGELSGVGKTISGFAAGLGVDNATGERIEDHPAGSGIIMQ